MKKVKYPNLNDYDLSAYEELKGDILYRINGGKVMDQADLYAMQQSDAHHVEETKEEILKNYENTETPSSTPPTNTQTTPPATNTTPQQTTALTTEEQVEMAKKDAEKKNNSGGGESSSGNGSGSGSGNTNDGSSGSPGATKGNSSANPYEGRKTSLTNEEQYEMARKDAERKNNDVANGIMPTSLSAEQQYEMARLDMQRKTSKETQYGFEAGYVMDKEGAHGMGHAGWFVQTINGKYSFFEIIGISQGSNGIAEYTNPGRRVYDKLRKSTMVLSNNPLSFPTPASADSSGTAKQAGCLLRDFNSREEMSLYLNKLGFDEMIVFNNNSRQNSYIFEASLEKGLAFEGYQLFNNSCGVVARDSLIVDGSGINSVKPYTGASYTFSSSTPNEIGNNLHILNQGSYRVDLK